MKRKGIRLQGFSKAMVIIFIALAAFGYFVAYPFITKSIKESNYEKLNSCAEEIYNAATTYVNEYDGAVGREKPGTIYCYKLVSWNGNLPTTSIYNQVSKDVSSEYRDFYYTVILDDYGKVATVYTSKTENEDGVIGCYPNPLDFDNPKYTNLQDCK